MDEEPSLAPRRCGFVAIVGAPNAGKSTLVNTLVGTKVSIVTHKVQTTRFALRGVAMRGPVQLVLVDTPGVFEPRRRLDRAMVQSAFAAMDDADAIVHLVDAAALSRLSNAAERKAETDAARITGRLKSAGRTAVLVLNKVDGLARQVLLPLTQRLFEPQVYEAVFMISARTADGVEDLASMLAERMPEGPWLYPEDQAGDAPARLLAAEITREKLMLRLHEELPYDTTVETETWKEQADGAVRIEQVVFVAREGQRKIAIGDKAATVKAIGQAAREDLERLFERRVHLFLTVKVRENWSEERARYEAMGLDFEA